MFEEIVSGTPGEVGDYFTKNQDNVRGEFVVIVQ
jgi:16S rRNA C1402 (ribose-2'-O) methylase RsmI